MTDEQARCNGMVFDWLDLLCLGLAIVELTLKRQCSWWRVLLPLWTMVGHNALFVAVEFV